MCNIMHRQAGHNDVHTGLDNLLSVREMAQYIFKGKGVHAHDDGH